MGQVFTVPTPSYPVLFSLPFTRGKIGGVVNISEILIEWQESRDNVKWNEGDEMPLGGHGVLQVAVAPMPAINKINKTGKSQIIRHLWSKHTNKDNKQKPDISENTRETQLGLL